jgi:hypothetical protein
MGKQMNHKLSTHCEWIASSSARIEERLTTARLRIAVGDNVATRVYDRAAQSIRDRINVPLYPLAYWLAYSWWRLSYEPSHGGAHSSDWRMSHEVPSVGHGCLWPPITFAPDGECVLITVLPSELSSTENISYVKEFRESIPIEHFESSISSFVEFVLKRLDAVDLRNTELHTLWLELTEERQNDACSRYRRLEAALGYDPDESPQNLVTKFQGLSSKIGADALIEIAPVCSGPDPTQILEGMLSLSETPGIEATIQRPVEISHMIKSQQYNSAPAWERGRMLAREVRRKWFPTDIALSDLQLSDMLKMPANTFEYQADISKYSIGLAVRKISGGERLKLLFRRRVAVGRRFEAARFLASALTSNASNTWLPTTDTKTVHQKVQRAFAAEFLCPIDHLKGFLNDNVINDESIEDASHYFGVSPLAVRSHLENNGVIDASKWVDVY